MALGKIKADTLEHSTAGSLDTQYVVKGSAKAWSNTNAAGTTINGSFNVSTLTDTGTGIQTIAYTSAMANAIYSATISMASDAANHEWLDSQATTGIAAKHYTGSAYADVATMWQIIGDLA